MLLSVPFNLSLVPVSFAIVDASACILRVGLEESKLPLPFASE